MQLAGDREADDPAANYLYFLLICHRHPKSLPILMIKKWPLKNEPIEELDVQFYISNPDLLQ
jgi:hypothetical protein